MIARYVYDAGDTFLANDAARPTVISITDSAVTHGALSLDRWVLQKLRSLFLLPSMTHEPPDSYVSYKEANS